MTPQSASASWSGILLVKAIVITSLGLYLLIAIAANVGLFADGALAFLEGLDFPPDFWLHPRLTSRILVRLPLYAALWAGVTDLGPLHLAFATGLFGHFAVTLTICALAVRDRPVFLFFPLASFFLASANASFFAFTGSHVAVSLFWSLLFVLLMPARWSWRWLVTAIALSIGVMASYESMAVFGLVLAGAALWRFHAETAPILRAGATLVGILCLSSVVVSIAGLHMRGVDHFVAKLPTGGLEMRGHGIHALSVIALGLISVVPRMPWRSWSLAAGGLATAGILWLGAAAWMPGETINPYAQHRVRLLNLLVPLVLTALFFVAKRAGPSWTSSHWLRAWRLLAIMALIQTSWFMMNAAQWQHALRLTDESANTGSGLRPFEETPLNQELVSGHPVRTFFGGWNVPILTLLAARNGQVRAIVANPRSWTGWVAFDPADLSELAYLKRYGYSFDLYEAAMRSAVP